MTILLVTIVRMNLSGAMTPFKRIPRDDPSWSVANYYCRFSVKGRPYLWSTKTNDIALAKKRGKAYRDAVIAGAYQLVDSMKTVSGVATFERLFHAYMELPAPCKRTKTVNVGSMRLVMASNGLTANDRLDRLSAQTVLKHQQVSLAARPDDPSALVTTNGHIRRARSLFSKRAMVSYTINVPEQAVAGFFKVPMLKEPEPRRELPTPAADALAHTSLTGELYRAYLLARYAGLRAGEIMAARRDWLDGTTLYIGGKEFVAKSRKWRAVELPAIVAERLQHSDDPVYLVGPGRLNTVGRLMAPALKALGFPKEKPLHSVRRLFGSHVYTEQGPRQARDVLGHSTQAVTDKHYARSLDMPKAVAFAG